MWYVPISSFSLLTPWVSMAALLLLQKENGEVLSRCFPFLALPACCSGCCVLGVCSSSHTAAPRLAPAMAAGWAWLAAVSAAALSAGHRTETDSTEGFIILLSIQAVLGSNIILAGMQARYSFLLAFLTSPSLLPLAMERPMWDACLAKPQDNSHQHTWAAEGPGLLLKPRLQG